MGKIKDEKKLLKKLGIESLQQMTKEKAAQFAIMFPKIDSQLAKKALEQFPQFKEYALHIIDIQKQTLDREFDENKTSIAAYYTACNEIITSLREELKRVDIDAEERSRIEDKMIAIAQMMAAKDSENKKFIAFMTVVGATAATVLAGAAAVIFGVKPTIIK